MSAPQCMLYNVVRFGGVIFLADERKCTSSKRKEEVLGTTVLYGVLGFCKQPVSAPQTSVIIYSSPLVFVTHHSSSSHIGVPFTLVLVFVSAVLPGPNIIWHKASPARP